MKFRRALFVFAAWWAGAGLVAQPASIPAAETGQKPTAQRLAAIHAAAQRDGWAPQTGILRAAALQAYEQQKLAAAEAWFYLFRWAALFGQMSASEFGPQWIAAVNAAKVGHTNMARQVTLENRPLGLALTPPLQLWLLGNAAFSEEFFSLLAPVDYVPEVFRILNDLHRRDPVKFKTYASLALAIDVVYDVPPPPYWPHGQVPSDVLPPRFQ